MLVKKQRCVGEKTKMNGTITQLTEDYINVSQHYLKLLSSRVNDEAAQNVFRECGKCAIAANVGRDAEVEKLGASIFYRMLNEFVED